MFGHPSTREIALRAEQRIESHEDVCSRRYKEAAEASDRVHQALDKLKDDLDARHEENTIAINRLQQRLLIGALLVLLSIVLKGNAFETVLKLFIGT